MTSLFRVPSVRSQFTRAAKNAACVTLPMATNQQVLDDTRREMAQLYLRRPDASIKRVAEQLGFEDPSNLFRACKRWFGESPGAYRARFVPPPG